MAPPGAGNPPRIRNGGGAFPAPGGAGNADGRASGRPSTSTARGLFRPPYALEPDMGHMRTY